MTGIAVGFAYINLPGLPGSVNPTSSSGTVSPTSTEGRV